MKLELSNPIILKDTIDTISRIINECRINFNEDNVTISALDQSHITFIQLEYQKTLFDEYQTNQPESIFIDTHELNNIIRRCNNTDILTLETDTNNLILTFKGEAEKQFKIRLIDDEYDTAQPPSIDYPYTITVPSTIIKEALTDSKVYSENLRFSLDQDYFHTRTVDGAFGDYHSRYLHGENIDGVVESGFSIDMLNNIFTAAKLNKECKLSLGDNMPLTVEFSIGLNDGFIRFLLAPRISEE